MGAYAAYWVVAAITAGSAIENHKQNEAASRQRDKLAVLEQSQRAAEATRARRAQIRQQLADQAKIENTAANAGQQGSSAPIAAVADVQAQTNENIGQIATNQAYGAARTSIENNIFKLQQPNGWQEAYAVAGALTSTYTTATTKKGG